MRSTDLEFFMAVNQASSIAGAASMLNTVQSNVTSRIKRLENELGVALFERHSRGVKLTPAGEQLLPFAIEIGQLLREARLTVSASDAPRGPLAIGAMETTTAFRLGGTLAAFASGYPDVDLTLRTGPTAELVEQVLHQQLEGAFVWADRAYAAQVEGRVRRRIGGGLCRGYQDARCLHDRGEGQYIRLPQRLLLPPPA